MSQNVKTETAQTGQKTATAQAHPQTQPQIPDTSLKETIRNISANLAHVVRQGYLGNYSTAVRGLYGILSNDPSTPPGILLAAQQATKAPSKETLDGLLGILYHDKDVNTIVSKYLDSPHAVITAITSPYADVIVSKALTPQPNTPPSPLEKRVKSAAKAISTLYKAILTGEYDTNTYIQAIDGLLGASNASNADEIKAFINKIVSKYGVSPEDLRVTLGVTINYVQNYLAPSIVTSDVGKKISGAVKGDPMLALGVYGEGQLRISQG